MENPIVECIANYSEARRPLVVEDISNAIRAVQGVHLLDRHSDLDHNRTVLTFAGAPAAVEEAAFRSIAKAAELIDLDEHTGEHPRIGATDVVPFVPISGISMAECVEIARRLGRRVGEELGIPVYLYEEAAARPERRNLENLRRGEYEGLKVEIAGNLDRAPDFGPRRLGKAGATVIGARHPLIAFNVYLTSEDVSIAKKIARTIRFSSGGLRYLKALGLLVEGRAQVSMNLTNYKSTALAQVVEMIRREASRYGVGVHHSELVGLIPQEALVETAVWYLQLDQFEPEQILERRLSAALQQPDNKAQAEAATPAAFLEALASADPTPGGGSAAAYSGAIAAALVAMVARLTIGRKKYSDVQELMSAVLEKAEALRADLTADVERDAGAYQAVMAAYKLPKDSPQTNQAREAAAQAAILQAARVPLDVARKSVEVIELASQVVAHGNLNAISDGGSAAAQARAALTSAGYNVRTNVNSLGTTGLGTPLLEELSELEKRAATIEAQIESIIDKRGGLSTV
jgi:glutamate formiminotransferase/formiminotetrahydrofolate cyclodeaminase